ncbi:hypothetical protein GCM10023205_37720 [Yinghuangia aomiensis]|uniref:Uncharacterized protein n=1 Tax=Yinghuangia aomiensis TaxID=676205 RepID=A0ABP9HE61_9ACTN
MIFSGPANTFAGWSAAGGVAALDSDPPEADPTPDPPVADAPELADCDWLPASDLAPESDLEANWMDTMIPTTGITIPTTHHAHFG